MDRDQSFILKYFKIRKIMWPIIIGLIGTFGLIFYHDMVVGDGNTWASITSVKWTYQSLIWIFLGFLLMIIRDLSYSWRLKILSDNQLSWRSSIEIVLLWEFTSAVSPSVVGGSAIAIFLLSKENIAIGRGTALIFMTIFLDEVFYLMILPIVVLFLGHDPIFSPLLGNGESIFGTSLVITFWVFYLIIFLYTCFLAFALFLYPYGVHRAVKRLFLTRLLKRWHRKGFKMADDLFHASQEFRSKPLSYWLKAALSTLSAWMARYLVLNCVIAAFAVISLGLAEHVLAFARQAIMFVMMLLSPTPGSAGVAEFMFSTMLGDLTPPGLDLALAGLWRLISYYPYLLVGLIILPRWLNRVYPKKDTHLPTNGTSSNGSNHSKTENTQVKANIK